MENSSKPAETIKVVRLNTVIIIITAAVVVLIAFGIGVALGKSNQPERPDFDSGGRPPNGFQAPPQGGQNNSTGSDSGTTDSGSSI